ncbi:MAG: 50S ribosomal protein L35 [Candidatus Ancillula sp.]|jgi:large subunit ribosomal protein L35|nr:50S ribosomal protein L35 [Candidatus Ancillula sp.]
MPKNKTHSGIKKRVRVTGSGKLMREGTKMRHNLEKKSSHKQRELKRDQVMARVDVKSAKKLLGI